MSDEEYLRDEYITAVIASFIEATMNKERDYEAYKQAKADLVKLIHEFKGDK